MPNDKPEPAEPRSPYGAGSDLGPYHILDLIGEGGFGAVYLAEQREPVRRRVALKLIKPGMDSKEVIARFEAERQALAMLDHPNVAKVFDAGLTDQGLPYFAMEHVPGVSITEYCDQAKLSVRERIALFISVCFAVQHAHQKGIIHRDLKPSNILVTMFDGKPMPKVIDFGIAKATTGHQLTDKTLYTEAGRMIGTPEYMSPEQAGTTGLDVDTRTDVYSLGVILYQLLSGSMPFDSRQLREAGVLEVLRVIKEVEPDRLSTRLASTDTQSAAQLRQVDARELLRELRGDLDWIVLRAMEKDRTRRYETANGLALDLQRFLDNEAVLARPPSAAYRLSRFARRNRAAAIAIGAIALALIAGVIGTTWGLLEARTQRDDAVAANQALEEQRDEANRLSEEAVAQRTAAVAALGEAQQLTKFLNDVLGLADPNLTQDPNLTMRRMLDAAAGQVARALKGQLGAEATVRATIGRAYATLGEPALAAEQLDRALEILDEQGEKSPDVLYAVLLPYAGVLQDLDDGDWISVGARKMAVGRQAIGVHHAELAACLDTWYSQCLRDYDRTRTDTAFRAVTRATEILGPEDREIWIKVAEQLASGGWVLAWLQGAQVHGAYDAAIQYVEAGRDILRDRRRGDLPATHTQAVRALGQLLDVYLRAERYPEAETVVRETIEQLTGTLPEAHPHVAAYRCVLADIRRRLGDFDEAEQLFAANYARVEAGFGPNHGRTVELLTGYIALLDARAKTAAADGKRRDLAATMAATSRVPDPAALRTILGPTSAELLAAIEALERAITENAGVESAFDALIERSSAFDADDPRDVLVGRFLGDRGIQHHKLLKRANEATARALVEAIRLSLSSNPEKLQAFCDYASYNAGGLGDFAAAEAFARKGIAVCLEHFGARDGKTLWLRFRLGRALRGLDRLTQAETELRAAWTASVETQGASSYGSLTTVRNLIAVLAELGREQDAVEVARDSLQDLIEAGAGASQLNSSAWAIVRLKNATADDYQVARAALDRALELEPDHDFAIGSLGSVLYRLGDHGAAIEALTRSERVRREHGLAPTPVDLLSLAMAQWQLGQQAEARAALERVRALMQGDPVLAANQDNSLFLSEAEELIR